jgi:hypothetical protein
MAPNLFKATARDAHETSKDPSNEGQKQKSEASVNKHEI